MNHIEFRKFETDLLRLMKKYRIHFIEAVGGTYPRVRLLDDSCCMMATFSDITTESGARRVWLDKDGTLEDAR